MFRIRRRGSLSHKLPRLRPRRAHRSPGKAPLSQPSFSGSCRQSFPGPARPTDAGNRPPVQEIRSSRGVVGRAICGRLELFSATNREKLSEGGGRRSRGYNHTGVASWKIHQMRSIGEIVPRICMFKQITLGSEENLVTWTSAPRSSSNGSISQPRCRTCIEIIVTDMNNKLAK